MTFPSNPNDDDLHTAFGRRLRYRSGKWQVVSSPIVATVTEEAPKTEAVAQAADLPMTGNEIGAMAYVSESNRLYIWNGSGWFEVALVNTNPTITAGGSATYELATDGTPTVVTLTANDPEGIPLTWSYNVTSGSLGDTTVTNVDNVFTINPGTSNATFDLTFSASDGVNLDTSVSSFTLSFPGFDAATFVSTLANPLAIDYTWFSRAVDIDHITQRAIGTSYGSQQSGIAWILNTSTGAVVHTINNPGFDGKTIDDGFGDAVAISGNYAAISCVKDPHNSDWRSSEYGQVHIYDVTSGSHIRTLNSPNPVYQGKFGNSVAMEGNNILIGAFYENTPPAGKGRAYLFDVTTGTLLHTFSGLIQGNGFGKYVALSGNYAVIGSAYVAFVYDITTGNLVYTFDPAWPYYDGYHRGIQSLAISSKYVVLGGAVSKPNDTPDTGKAKVYRLSDGALLHTLSSPNTTSYYDPISRFGRAVACTSSEIIVGAAENNKSDGIYVFDGDTGILTNTIGPGAGSTGFGSPVAVSGDLLITSAIWHGGNGRGRVDIYKAN